MKYTARHRSLLAALTAGSLLAGGPAAYAATFDGSPQARIDTSRWQPPSPDPSGVVFDPATGELLVSDSEVNEMPLYAGSNLFRATTKGVTTARGTTVPWSNEPTGIGLDPTKGDLFISDDDKKSVFVIAGRGPDKMFGTADDGKRTQFKTSAFGNTDPEDVSYDTKRKELLTVDGVGAKMFRLSPGQNGVFDGVAPGGDDIAKEYDLAQFGAIDPEGIAYDDVRDTVVILDGSSEVIYELDPNGSLMHKVNVRSAGAVNAAGIAVGPASDGSGKRNYYMADRGLDNNSHPTENDGAIHEVAVALPAITNRPPSAYAGEDQLMDRTETAQLAGRGTDPDGPNATLTYQWSKFSGPGAVTFGSGQQPATSATFSQAGVYVLRLTVNDGEHTDIDDVTVHVFEPGAPRSIDIPIAAGADDAMEGGGSSGNFVDLASADVELGENQNGVSMVNGLRFTGIPVPQGGEILSARIQFKVDETGSGPASYTIRGEAADNATTYLSQHGNITARSTTGASVDWAPPAWTVIGDNGPGQQTPDLASVLQEIVDRPGWKEGNAAAFVITGNGRRTAEAKDGLTPPVLQLRFHTEPASGAAVDATLSRGAVPVGKPARVTGTVRGSAAGQPLRLERRAGAGWETVDTATLPGGDATYAFTVRPQSSGIDKYRVVAAAHDGLAESAAPGGSKALRLRVYEAEIAKILPKADVLKLRNTGAVRAKLTGWTLKSKKAKTTVTLPKFVLKPGRMVRIHSGQGSNDGNDLYLGSGELWGKRSVAVLRDKGALVDRFRR